MIQQKKIDQSLRLIESVYKQAEKEGKTLELCYSGGKDSDVMLTLAKMAGVCVRPIYKNTTIDPAGTICHVKKKGVEIIHPKITFYELIKKKGIPTRFSRFCCAVLKEYKIEDMQLIGVRRGESVRRSKRYIEPQRCRYFGKNEYACQTYPILEWTNEDIRDFVEREGIECHPLYYDEKGLFHVERRLGCMCCPLASVGKRVEAFKKNTKMLKIYLKGAEYFLNTHQNGKTFKLFGSDFYKYFVANIFYERLRDFYKRYEDNMFGNDYDFEDLVKSYFSL